MVNDVRSELRAGRRRRTILAAAVWIVLAISAAAHAAAAKILSARDTRVIRCGDLPEPTQGTVCDASPGSRSLLILGDVLATEAVYQGGEVLVDATGLIAYVGCSTDRPSSLSTIAETATRITCEEGVISPGLINAHDHLSFDHSYPFPATDARHDHRNDWRSGGDVTSNTEQARVAWSELRQAIVGTTAIAGAGGTAGFLRNLDWQQFPAGDDLLWDLFTTAPTVIASDTFPLENPTDYLQHEGDCSEYPYLGRGLSSDPDVYLPHVAEGINEAAHNEFACLSSTARNGRDIVDDKLLMIHGMALRPEDGESLAANGAGVIWSPRSNVSLYGNTTPVTMLRNQGVPISLGTDWTPSGSMHLGRELACAAELNRTYFAEAFNDRELWSMVTSNPARALKVQDKIGALEPGLFADIAIYDGRGQTNPYRVVMGADAARTVLVLRRSSLPFPFVGGPKYGGSIALYGDANVLESLPSTLHEDYLGMQLCEPLAVCALEKMVCPLRETWWTPLAGLGAPLTLSALSTANADSYPLYFCGVPPDEPSCIPSRASEYDGTIDLQGPNKDRDGDGIADPVDNCRRVFNPIRPMDHGVQPDTDRDGRGDACDLCPLSAGEVCRGTEAVRAFHAFVERWFPGAESWGITDCRRIAGTSQWSQHAYSNAEDWRGSRSTMRKIFETAIQLHAKFQVATIIHDAQIWRFDWPGGPHPYEGADPHHDHVHLDFLPERSGVPACARRPSSRASGSLWE